MNGREMIQLTLFFLILPFQSDSIAPSALNTGTISLYLTSKDNLTELFVDGKEIKIPLHRPWNQALEFILSGHTRLISLRSTAAFESECPGVVGSVGEYFLTSNSTCRCSKVGGPTVGDLGFDDSGWKPARFLGLNDGKVPKCPSMVSVQNVSTSASWVWTETGVEQVVSYCRCYLPLCEKRNPCQNNATCLKNDPKLCSCRPDYTGTYCQFTTCEKENPCKNKGVCEITNGQKICKCPANYFGQFCEIPSCSLVNPCENNGTCLIDTVKRCLCPPYFFGEFCQIDKSDPCSKRPCHNGAVCISTKPVNGSYSGEYKCNCRFGYTGNQCDTGVSSLELQLTAKEFLGALYVDGSRLFPLQNDDVWNKTSRHVIPNYSRLVAVVGSNIENDCAGIIVSASHGYLLSGVHWGCSNETRMGWSALGYQDSTWSQAQVTGKNDLIGITTCKSGIVSGLPGAASWIWTNQSKGHDLVVYCRGYIDTCKSKPCHNGGTCNANHPALCLCSPGYSGRFCEKVNFKSLKVTAKEKIEVLYIDATRQLLRNGSSWNAVDSYSLHPNVRLVSILATDVNDLRANCSGILSSVDLKWKCTNRATSGWYQFGYNDSTWTSAPALGQNGKGGRCPDVTKPIADIPSESNWFWTLPVDSLVSYCRGYFPICSSNPCHNGGTCNINLPKLCSCLPTFTGIYCELKIGVDVPE